MNTSASTLNEIPIQEVAPSDKILALNSGNGVSEDGGGVTCKDKAGTIVECPDFIQVKKKGKG
ncbi:MAG: hypothetical protein WBX01_04170 [Nitrososphaeraceae archaeon]